MTHDEKTFVVHFVLFWVFMLAVLSEWIFGWPSEQQLAWTGAIWIIVMFMSFLLAIM